MNLLICRAEGNDFVTSNGIQVVCIRDELPKITISASVCAGYLYETAANAGITDLVNAYAVAEVLFDAMRRAGTSDPEAVNAEIANTNGEYAVGHIEFTPEHTMTIPVVQSQWHGNDQLLVLGPDGKARNPIEAPTPGLR